MSKQRRLRQLRNDEIEVLEKRGCVAEDWSCVRVSDGFAPGRSFYRVYFSGSVELGAYEGVVRTSEGFAVPAGIVNSSLHDVRVGDNCALHYVTAASTDIGDNCILDQVGHLSRIGDHPFANGLQANVLTEDGARSVPLWRNLDSGLAHLLCHFKKQPAALELEKIILRDAEALRLPRSVISAGCLIRRVGQLKNVWLGEGSSLEGVALLDNCHVDSTREAPARIGEGVSARDCVFQRACTVAGGVRLDHCLVGEGVKLEDGFTGKHSLFFANSEFGLGEADCVMAGPFSVSLHKASLALTCQCSFANFGSAANASNHHFKLGPRHGGVMRRGVKCGSGSYLFWPADIGAFTTVIGRHVGNLDTSDFPFSLLVAEEGRSTLVPGVNLFTSGMLRDGMKWRERDRRGGVPEPRDLVNPAILSPYVLQAMETGADLLRRCKGISMDVMHGGAVIPSPRIEPALRLYDAAIIFHVGERLFARAAAEKNGGFPGVDDLIRQIEAGTSAPRNLSAARWRDWGGLLVPGIEAERFVADMENGMLGDYRAIRERLMAIHGAYPEYEWAALAWRWRLANGDPTPETMAAFVERWRKTVQFRHERIIRDIGKEFSPEARYGYGVELDAAASFRLVRGVATEHSLVAMAEAEADSLLAMAGNIPPPR